jgi:hypothetical protein
MKMNDHVIISANISEAWARGFLAVANTSQREFGPLVVTINTTFGVQVRPDIRALLDSELSMSGEASVDTVSGTIFPKSLWNPTQPRSALYERYERIWPIVKKTPQNQRGTYFRRFTAFGDEMLNQLETVLSTFEVAQKARRGHRRSALQLAVLDPTIDHVQQPRLGFPCLHQVSIVPGSDRCLSLTGYYATQTMFEKAYGNYLGLVNLGTFVAHELGMPLASVTCVTSIALLGQARAVTLSKERSAFCKKLAALLPEGR